MKTARNTLIGLAFGAAFASAVTCTDWNLASAILPEKVGEEGQTTRAIHVLRCDTVRVPKGKTTVLHAGALLYFDRPDPSNSIRVEGTLIVRGAKDYYVALAGGRDPKSALPEPGKIPWGGILVEPGGRLEFQYASIYGASTPITVFSRQVKIVNSFFVGGTGLVKPDGSVHELNPRFAAVNFLDFSAPEAEPPALLPPEEAPSAAISKGEKLSEEEKQALLAKRKKFWNWPLTVFLAGGGLVGGAAVVYLATRTEEHKMVDPGMNDKPRTLQPR